jgi:hypothetical protein
MGGQAVVMAMVDNIIHYIVFLQCESVFHSSKEDWENDRKNPEEVISIVTGLKLSIMMSA